MSLPHGETTAQPIPMSSLQQRLLFLHQQQLVGAGTVKRGRSDEELPQMVKRMRVQDTPSPNLEEQEQFQQQQCFRKQQQRYQQQQNHYHHQHHDHPRPYNHHDHNHASEVPQHVDPHTSQQRQKRYTTHVQYHSNLEGNSSSIASSSSLTSSLKAQQAPGQASNQQHGHHGGVIIDNNHNHSLANSIHNFAIGTTMAPNPMNRLLGELHQERRRQREQQQQQTRNDGSAGLLPSHSQLY